MQDDDTTDSLLAAVARIPPRELARTWTPPFELDEYRLLRPLGDGGMGSVWLAQDRLLDRLVAIKFIAHAAPDPATRERFAIEARAAARLSHVNVVTVHRFGEVAGRPYLVSEYLRGDSLDAIARPVSWERSLDIGIEIARGLAAAHRAGIVHRDIKPANAILTADGHAKLVDFGLAKLGRDDAALAAGPAAGDPVAALTQPGAIAGTPRYLAPEVRAGEPATRASDVYQVGCILYELLTGRAPILDVPEPGAEVPSLVDRVPGAAARLAAVVDRCLRPDPGQRFASGDDLREALERLATVPPGGELPEGNPYRGLLAFDAEHRSVFFGRGPDIRAVIERLRADPFVVVAGDSGAGKTSLCRAGVLPHVVEGALGDGLAWSVIAAVPGRRPLTALAGATAAALGLDAGVLADAMRDEPTRLVRELRRGHSERRGAVVFVDQLEELVTVADHGEARACAVVLGQLALGAPGIRLLATVRADYLARIAELPGLGELARALYLLRSLTIDGARDAVIGPARAKGARFESDALVEGLVAAIAGPDGEPGRAAIELPLLAFTLSALWDARDAMTQTISARTLEAIGGVRGALANHADRVLDGLLPAQRAAARELLLRLVTPERTRVRRTADELAGLDPGALDALVRGRLVVARGGDEPTFELAHERLIDGWPALAGWLSETAEAAAVRARLAAAVAEWNRLGRGKDLLWSERRLADLAALSDKELTPDATRFVAASRRAMRQRRFRRRGVAIAVPIVLASLYVGARVVARRDLDQHIAASVGDADRALARARPADADGMALAAQAFARFDAGDPARGELLWDAARRLADEAHAAYGEAARGLEAAFLLDTDRDDVRRRLAELNYELLQRATRDHRTAERAELTARLPLYDRGELASRLAAPASLAIELQPGSAAASVEPAVAPLGSSAAPVRARGAGPLRLAPGSYVVVARAEGRADVRMPIVLGPGEQRRLAIALPPASDVPAGFVYVPAGSFLYGSRDDDAIRGFLGAEPMHGVATPAYLIARTEVTYQQWIEFLDAQDADERARRTPRVDNPLTPEAGDLVELRHAAGGWELHMTTTISYVARAGSSIEYRDRAIRRRQDWLQFPVSGISPEDAAAYAAWLDRTRHVPHARLCNEHEWERAARGADGRAYPRGDQLAPDDANFDLTYGQREGGFGPDVVGAHPGSTSVFGLVDMSGNVWEIVRPAAGDGFVMRGGCFFTARISTHLANRAVILPSYRHLHVGVRLCADLP
ncbi:MAG TPA: bifunctional serine/threonine-protein kinase/formylglycine-generating enzyme family protein [Kofleriaceae bacterium]|nr:bifunctional serine/threonine-protein kinase/formylglycine-generating enzyme family protein [Kofleriaceae bacterium]